MLNRKTIALVLIALVAIFYAFNLQVRVDNLEATLDAIGDPDIAEFVASIGSANYHITEQGQDYASGNYFISTPYNDIASTPTIIFNCKYAREGTYTWMDPELERLDLKNTICSFYDCELTSDEQQLLSDKLSKLPTAERVAFYELEYGGCYNKTELYCSPTSSFCKEQQPIFREIMEELGIEWEMICISARSIDPALCSTLISFEGKTDVTFVEAMSLNQNLDFCEVNVAFNELEKFNLVEKLPQ